MRISKHCMALAFAALLPSGAWASDIVYFCHDDSGTPEIVRFDPARKHVTMISGRAPGRCQFQFSEGGAYGYEAPPGDYCVMGALLGGAKVRTFVSTSGANLSFGATGEGGTKHFTLDAANGLLEYDGGPDECHRAHG